MFGLMGLGMMEAEMGMMMGAEMGMMMGGGMGMGMRGMGYCPPGCMGACCMNRVVVCPPGCMGPCCVNQVMVCPPGCMGPCCVNRVICPPGCRRACCKNRRIIIINQPPTQVPVPMNQGPVPGMNQDPYMPNIMFPPQVTPQTYNDGYLQ
jgi:hypothetical protein